MSGAQPFIFLLVKSQVYTFFSFPFPSLFSFLQISSACGGRQSPPRGRVEQHGADPCAKASARGIGVLLLGFSCIIHGYHYYLSIFRRLVAFSLLSLGLYPLEEGKVQVFSMKMKLHYSLSLPICLCSIFVLTNTPSVNSRPFSHSPFFLSRKCFSNVPR
jgi:hypothetical protein